MALSKHQNIDNNELSLIIQQHLNDNEMVEGTFGCLLQIKSVSDFFIDVVDPDSTWVHEWHAKRKTKKLSSTLSNELDYKLINLPNQLAARDKALLRVKPAPELYSRIRELVIKEHNQAALVALAKFQKQQDIPLIIDGLESNNAYQPRTSHWFHAYKAVRFFPHPAFFPVLEKQFKQALKKHIVISDEDINIAIATYQDEPAMALLKTPIFSGATESNRTRFYQARFCALKQVSIPFYTPLFWEIWEKELILDEELWTYLSEQDPKRALALAKHSLNNIKIFVTTQRILPKASGH